MKNYKMVNGQNYFNEQSLEEMVTELEAGKTISIYIDCIGHARSYNEEEIYKEELIEKFGDRLIVEKCRPALYKLKK